MANKVVNYDDVWLSRARKYPLICLNFHCLGVIYKILRSIKSYNLHLLFNLLPYFGHKLLFYHKNQWETLFLTVYKFKNLNPHHNTEYNIANITAVSYSISCIPPFICNSII